MNINAQQATTNGVVPVVRPASSGGDRVRPGVLIRVTNGSGGTVVMSMVVHTKVDGITVPPKTVTIPDTETVYVRTTKTYVANDGWCDISFDNETDVDMEVFV